MEPMPNYQFANVIRAARNQPLETVVQLRTITYFTLRRLGVLRDLTKAHVGRVPWGSDHVDLGSLRDWMERLTKTDAAAIQQVVLLDATCTARVGSR